MSVVKLAIMVGRSPTLRMRTKGRSSLKSTSARSPTVASDGFFGLVRWADEADEEVCLGFVGDDVGRVAAGDEADVEGGWADLGLERQRHGEDVVERLDELVDGGVAELGIGGVGHAAFGAEFDAEGALGGEGEAVVGGLAVDEEASILWAT